MRNHIIDYFHHPPFTGSHLGAPRVRNKVQARFFWPTLIQNVQDRVRSCTVCQQSKSDRTPPPAVALHATPTPRLFEKIAIYFIGPLPPSLHRNRYILSVTDYFSRWAEAYALPDATAESTAVCLADWITRYGAPLEICSDRGAHFLNSTITAFSRIWHITQTPVSAYHPQANGLVERFNGTLCDILRSYAFSCGTLWDELLGAALFAYRTSFHMGINTSHNTLVYGQTLRVPLDVELDQFLHDAQ